MARSFVALDVPSDGLHNLVRFSADQPPHVTLAFLGEVPSGRLESLSRELAAEAGACAPFPFEISGVGAFPSAAHPRVVWVGFSRGNDAIGQLAARVADGVRRWGGRVDSRPFTPHVTLFRVHGAERLRRARELLEGPDPGPLGAGEAREFALKESRLDRSGAVHSIVRRFRLGEPR